ncbi:hypothetical protein HCH15_03505 [Corynebacterium testudinoris]|uniref:hypothetical protein n=1 Tax=Corynebacterium testudinoris TaxID=136857 RepID=UPI001C8B9DD0|nr:hypothetical protein [Corynebacterium testudinoris]MBX8995251.1 hypothetical protein [Corynebacterium testudinoris]
MTGTDDLVDEIIIDDAWIADELPQIHDLKLNIECAAALLDAVEKFPSQAFLRPLACLLELGFKLSNLLLD